MKVEDYFKNLEDNREEPSDDPYDNRITHCYLKYTSEPNMFHFFEVRGWSKIEDDKINVSAVNWTVCAGTCSLTITDKNCDDFEILTCKEYNKLMESLEYIRDEQKWYYTQKEEG